jgi:NAD(P)-dependent dehydrogenase (short-subunit alcohol dehydrogenase family)
MASRVILVTGSNTGIGYAAAHILAAKGHVVYISSRKEHAGKEAVCDHIDKSA